MHKEGGGRLCEESLSRHSIILLGKLYRRFPLVNSNCQVSLLNSSFAFELAVHIFFFSALNCYYSHVISFLKSNWSECYLY